MSWSTEHVDTWVRGRTQEEKASLLQREALVNEPREFFIVFAVSDPWIDLHPGKLTPPAPTFRLRNSRALLANPSSLGVRCTSRRTPFESRSSHSAGSRP